MNLHHWPHLYLFLFSHMRSYSTLLSHVLGSHREILLLHVTHHLGLAAPLQPQYQVRRLSGESGYGDVSANIRSGSIRRGGIEDPQLGTSIEIDPALLERCTRAYRACMMTLVDWCPSLPRREIPVPQPIAESLVA